MADSLSKPLDAGSGDATVPAIRDAARPPKIRIARASDAAGGTLVVPLGPDDPVPPELAAEAARAGWPARHEIVLDTPQGRRVLVRLDGEDRRAAERAGGRGFALAPARRVRLEAAHLAPELAAAIAAGVALRGGGPTRGHEPGEAVLGRLDIVVAEPGAARRAWARWAPELDGALLARALVAAPANRLTPAAFGRALEGLSAHGIAVDVLGRRRLARDGFGALLAVDRGARLAVLRWRGSFAAAPIVLVGKGVCFDAGGLALKPAAGLAAMRGDMAGAAACVGAMLALAMRRCPAPVMAVLPLAENLPGAAAHRPGDVLRMRSGRTVEVVDPDAEGRLVLADAIGHVVAGCRPRALVTVGTLTGAARIALGAPYAALYGSDAALTARLAAAGEATGEALWPMPIGAAHRADLRSAIADLRQCTTGRAQPDASHAAAFLEAFVPAGVPWAHLDIAGVAEAEEDTPLARKGPTGFGARLLARFVDRRWESPDEP